VGWYQKKHTPTRTHEEEEEGFAQTTRSIGPLHSALSQRRLLNQLSQHTNKVGRMAGSDLQLAPLTAPDSVISPFLRRMPVLPQPFQFIIGLHTQWLG